VTLAVPGSAPHWRIDFYDTTNGTTIMGSAVATRQGANVTVAFPDFSDDIAFRMAAAP